MDKTNLRAAKAPSRGNLERGLVVSAPVEIRPGKILLRAARLNKPGIYPQELRFALLFWDKLAWPAVSSFLIYGSEDEKFLESAGVLFRPKYHVSLPFFSRHGSGSALFAKAHIQAFIDLERREPGVWALAQGENSLLIRNRLLRPGRGALVELHRAIPVPDKDVPLNEIMEFRAKRRDELLLLRTEIDTLMAAINAARDKEAELAKHVMRVDAACADAIKVGKEWQFPMRLTNLKASVELRPFVSLLGFLAPYALGKTTGLPQAAAVLSGLAGAAAATAPALKISADFGWRGLRPRPGPYRYVYQFHRALF